MGGYKVKFFLVDSLHSWGGGGGIGGGVTGGDK